MEYIGWIFWVVWGRGCGVEEEGVWFGDDWGWAWGWGYEQIVFTYLYVWVYEMIGIGVGLEFKLTLFWGGGEEDVHTLRVYDLRAM